MGIMSVLEHERHGPLGRLFWAVVLGGSFLSWFSDVLIPFSLLFLLLVAVVGGTFSG